MIFRFRGSEPVPLLGCGDGPSGLTGLYCQFCRLTWSAPIKDWVSRGASGMGPCFEAQCGFSRVFSWPRLVHPRGRVWLGRRSCVHLHIEPMSANPIEALLPCLSCNAVW